MKLNQTYPLMDLLDALTAASDNTRELAKQLKAEGRHMTVFTVYEAENTASQQTRMRRWSASFRARTVISKCLRGV